MAKSKAPKPEAEADGGADGADGAEGAPKKKRSLVKTLVMFVLPAVLVLGGAAYFFLLSGGEETAEGEGAQHAEAAPPPVFLDLPDMLVNLASASGDRAMLKLSVALELPDQETVAKIEPIMPRVTDNFQVFLRELRVEDLSGSAGMFRLKEELVRRVNLAVAPAVVKDVLFKEMLIQ